MSFKFNIKTYGCKVNTYDTGLLQKRLAQSGSTSCDQPEVHILNTCAVTAKATQEALREIRKLKSKNPLCKVVVTGCAAQVDTDQFADNSGVDLVVANSHKGELEDLITKHLKGELKEKVFKSNIFKKDDLEAGGGREDSHTRAFLKVQDGCNSFCSFCIIPFARGKSRSILIKDMILRVNQLYADGVREVVLTGVHIGDYQDKEKGLEDLVKALLQHTQMPRLRLSSLEPVELTDELMALYQDSRLCPHFHMSLQSANTKVLKGMKRQYRAQDVETALNKIHQHLPQAFVGMDVIVGFPGETHEDFMETYERLNALPWTRIHVFPYSPRRGTYAYRLELLDRREILRRAAQLRNLSWGRIQQKAQEQLGTTKSVLGLKAVGQALSHDFWPVQVVKPPSSQLYTVKIHSFKSHSQRIVLEGEALATSHMDDRFIG